MPFPYFTKAPLNCYNVIAFVCLFHIKVSLMLKSSIIHGTYRGKIFRSQENFKFNVKMIDSKYVSSISTSQQYSHEKYSSLDSTWSNKVIVIAGTICTIILKIAIK